MRSILFSLFTLLCFTSMALAATKPQPTCLTFGIKCKGLKTSCCKGLMCHTKNFCYPETVVCKLKPAGTKRVCGTPYHDGCKSSGFKTSDPEVCCSKLTMVESNRIVNSKGEYSTTCLTKCGFDCDSKNKTVCDSDKDCNKGVDWVCRSGKCVLPECAKCGEKPNGKSCCSPGVVFTADPDSPDYGRCFCKADAGQCGKSEECGVGKKCCDSTCYKDDDMAPC